MKDRIKSWNDFLVESLKGKLSFLEGKPISLVRTLHTIGKWNEEKGSMDKVEKEEDIDGFIGKIGEYEGEASLGFSLMDAGGKRKGFVMYDEKTGGFIEGDSTYRYTYRGKTEKDERILKSIVDNIN